MNYRRATRDIGPKRGGYRRMRGMHVAWRRPLAMFAAVAIVVTAASPSRADNEAIRLDPLVDLLDQLDDPAVQFDLLTGMHAGLRGRKHVAMPARWPSVYEKLSASKSAGVRKQAQLIALIFGDPKVITALNKTLMDRRTLVADRRTALQVLLEQRVDGLAPDLHRLVDEKPMRRAALQALAAYNNAATPDLILSKYSGFDSAERQDAINTLASRPSYALALLQATAKQIVRRTEISAFTARQLRGLGDDQVNKALHEVWGEVKETSQNKEALIAKYKAILTAKRLADADLSSGRLIYQQTCAKCHRLFDDGERIGPELTGSNRANLDYILENVLDPNAAIGKDYQLTNVTTADGRVLTGIIIERSTSTLTLQTANERVLLARDDIEEIVESEVSMMPEGQLDTLTKEQIRDLVAYLASPGQVPLSPGGITEK